jgi:hypothetical protein
MAAVGRCDTARGFLGPGSVECGSMRIGAISPLDFICLVAFRTGPYGVHWVQTWVPDNGAGHGREIIAESCRRGR